MRAQDKVEKDLMGDTSAREETGVRNLREAAAKLAPMTVLVALLSGMLAAACGVEFLLAVPLFVLASLAAGLIRRARLRREVDLPLLLPEPVSYTDTAARAGAARLGEARNAIVASIRPGGRLPRVVRCVGQLERRALNVIARLEYIGSFLSTCSPSQLESDIARLGSRATSRNDATRAAYERATDAYAARLETIRQLRTEHDVLLATLDHVLGTLEGVPARVTRLRLLEIDACTGPASEAADEVSRLDEELDLLEAACGPARAPGAQPEQIAADA